MTASTTPRPCGEPTSGWRWAAAAPRWHVRPPTWCSSTTTSTPLVAAVAEGRRIHANIRTFLRYGLAGGLAEVVVLLVALRSSGCRSRCTPAMILWINMVTHGLPGVAFGGEPLDPSLMRHPSHTPSRSILDRALTGQIAFAGLMVAVASLLAGVWAAGHDADVQTAVFVTLGLGQLVVAIALRAPRSRPAWRWRWRERGLELAVLFAAVCQLAGALAAPLQGLLGTETPGVASLFVSVALAAVPGVVVAVARRRTGPRS